MVNFLTCIRLEKIGLNPWKSLGKLRPLKYTHIMLYKIINFIKGTLNELRPILYRTLTFSRLTNGASVIICIAMKGDYYTVHVAIGYDKVRAPDSVGIWPLRPKCGGKFNHRKDMWFRESCIESIVGKAVHPCTECFSEGLELYILAAV